MDQLRRGLILASVLCAAACTGGGSDPTIALYDLPDGMTFEGLSVSVWELENGREPNLAGAGIIRAAGEADEYTRSCGEHLAAYPNDDCDAVPPFRNRPFEPDLTLAPTTDGTIELPSSDHYRYVRVVWPEDVDDCELGGWTVVGPDTDEAGTEIGLLSCA